MNILFNNETDKQIGDSTKVLIEKAVIESLKSLEIEIPVEVSVTITDNNHIKELNNEYRGKDTETDVLSFPMIDEGKILSDADLSKYKINEYELPIGDIVLSYEKAEEQAKEYGHSFERELAFLTVHSMLHLIGYDHETSEEEKEMFSMQEIILKKMGLSREANHV